MFNTNKNKNITLTLFNNEEEIGNHVVELEPLTKKRSDFFNKNLLYYGKKKGTLKFEIEYFEFL